MKSIFKKIALVLALAMVVTMLPAKSASVVAAAAEPNDWVRNTCTLYLDAPVPNDKYDTYVSEAYATAATKVKVKKNDEDGWGTKGYTVSFASADPSIAEVGEKYGLVTAKGIGQTTITATFSKEDEDDVVESFTVTVKSYAHSIALDEESEAALNALAVGGAPITLTAVVTDAMGNQETMDKVGGDTKLAQLFTERKYVTDYVKFSVTNPEDKEVLSYDAKTNQLKAVAEGEATLTAIAYRWDWTPNVKTNSGWYAWRTATQEYKVTVKNAVPTVTNATVKSVTKLELNVTGVTTENVKDIKITNEYDAPLNVLFKDPVLSEDGTTITLERYTEMTNGETLRFAFGEETPYELVVAIGALDHIVIEGPATAVIGVDTDLNIKFLDAAGVELSAPATGVRTTIDDTTYAYLDASGRKVTMYEAGRSIKIQVIYDTGRFNEEDWTPVEMKSNEFTILCVETPDVAASAILFKLASADGDFSANAVTIYMNSKDNDVKLLAQVALNNNDKPTSENSIGFTFETLNPAVLLVNPATGDLTPVSAGSARILVKYEVGTARITGVVTVEVRANAELRSVSPDKVSATVSNAEAVGETATFTFTGHDQYGQDFGVTASRDGITQNSAPRLDDNNTLDTLTITTDGNKVTFNPVGHKKGTYTYRVAFGGVSTVVSIIVREPVTDKLEEAASYRIVPVGGNVEVDMANFNGAAEYRFKIVAQDRTGVAFAIVQTLGSNDTLAVRFGTTDY